MKEFWEKFFQFLEKHLPAWVLAFASGYKLGAGGKGKLKKELLELKLEKETLENREKVRRDHDGLSSLDIVNDAIRQGSGKDPGTKND